MRLPLSLVAWIGLLQAFACAQVSRDTAEGVVAKVAEALGASRFPVDHPGIHVQGRATHYGIETGEEWTLDGRGRFRLSNGGPLPNVRTFDGTDAWVNDWTGAVHRLVLLDRDISLMSVWLAGGFWAMHPERFEITLLADKSTESEVVLSVKLRNGRFRAEISVDRATWLPTHAAGKIQGQTHAFRYDDFTKGPGPRLPRKWTQTSGGFTTTTRWDTVEATKPSPEDYFRLKTRGARISTFDTEKPGKLEVKRTVSGHLLVKPAIDGRDVGWFIFDTGAGFSVLDKKLIDRLGLKRFGEIPVGGAVSGPLKGTLVQPSAITLGPVTLRGCICIELDLAMISLGLGENIEGIIGYPLLQSAIVEIDCATPAITLHDPARYHLPDGVSWTPMAIDNYHPVVQAKYEGDRGGWFTLDTGDPGTVSFHTPTVRREKLLEGRKTRLTLQGGVGGIARARAGEIAWFELGSHHFEKPQVSFAESDQGAFANEYTAGNLGQAFFKPFRLVFDYGTERIGFVQREKGKLK